MTTSAYGLIIIVGIFVAGLIWWRDSWRHEGDWLRRRPERNRPDSRRVPPPPPREAALPARWANDPYRRHELRYWDGTAWTEHVIDAGVQATDAPT